MSSACCVRQPHCAGEGAVDVVVERGAAVLAVFVGVGDVGGEAVGEGLGVGGGGVRKHGEVGLQRRRAECLQMALAHVARLRRADHLRRGESAAGDEGGGKRSAAKCAGKAGTWAGEATAEGKHG
eukprot:5427993-Pleurochrysis_carterae.AAC.2